jgi:hypothetical protein
MSEVRSQGHRFATYNKGTLSKKKFPPAAGKQHFFILQSNADPRRQPLFSFIDSLFLRWMKSFS